SEERRVGKECRSRWLAYRKKKKSRRLNARNLFLSLILHLGNLFLIVQLHFIKLFLILKSGVNHTSRGSISNSTLTSIKLRKCSSKIITSILSFISGRLAIKSNFFFSSRRRHTRFDCDWSSDVCSSDLDGRCRRLRPLAKWLLRDERRVRVQLPDLGVCSHNRRNRARPLLDRRGDQLGRPP